MSEKGLTTIALKKINRSKIYQYIYRSKLTSKLQIVQDLQMGLSTVSQNLNLLENEGLIEKNGYFDSTGGRKANAIQIVSDFRISIGVGILKNMFHITAIDLYGNTVYTDTIPLTYSNTAVYYQQITDKVKDFIDKNQYPENKILGVSIATQGITSPDNTTVIYGNINHAGHQPHAPSGGAVIGNAGVLVELRTYSVADEISYHRVTASFDIRLHRVADIANAVARDSLLNA